MSEALGLSSQQIYQMTSKLGFGHGMSSYFILGTDLQVLIHLKNRQVQPEDGSYFHSSNFLETCFPMANAYSVGRYHNKNHPKIFFKVYFSLRRCWVCFTTRDSTSTERCSTSTKWRCGHPSSYATMTLENGVPLAKDGKWGVSASIPNVIASLYP